MLFSLIPLVLFKLLLLSPWTAVEASPAPARHYTWWRSFGGDWMPPLPTHTHSVWAPHTPATASAIPTPTPSYNPRPDWDPCESYEYAIKQLDYVRQPHDLTWVRTRAWKWVDCCHSCMRDYSNCMVAKYTPYDPTMNLPIEDQYGGMGGHLFNNFVYQDAGICELAINQVKLKDAPTTKHCSLGVVDYGDYNNTKGDDISARRIKEGYIQGPCWQPKGVMPFLTPVEHGVNKPGP